MGLFLVGLFAHESLLFMAPAQVLAVLLVAVRWTRLRVLLYWLTGSTAVAAIVICGFLLSLPQPDIAMMCAAVQTDCSGPAAWLEQTLDGNIAHVFRERSISHVFVHLGLLVLSAVPLLGMRVEGMSRTQHALVFVLCLVFALPLFVVASDWGRWIQMIIFPISLIAVAGIPAGYVQYRRILPSILAVVYVASWSLMHKYYGIDLRAVLILPVTFGFVTIAYMWNRRYA